MRHIRTIFIFAVFIAYGCGPNLSTTGGPPSPPSVWKKSGSSVTPKNISWSVAIGTAVSVVDTEYRVWEKLDSNGDVVASMTVTCSDITDGSQDCTVKIYEMVAGTLTNQATWP